MAADVECAIHENQRQQSVNDWWFCKYGNYTVIWSLLCISEVLADFVDKRDSNPIPTQFRELVSMERQRFVVL